MPVLRPLVLAVLAVLLLPAAALALDVRVGDDGVEPDPAVVAPGDPVVLVNEGADEVRLVDVDGRWDSGPLAPGESFRITFDAEGTIAFESTDGTVTGAIEVSEDAPPTEEADPAVPAGQDEPTAAPAAEAPATDDAAAEQTPEELAVGGAPSDLLGATALALLGAGAAVLRRTRA